MKRTICKFSLIAAIVLVLMLLTQPSYAAISITGEVKPNDNPATWTSTSAIVIGERGSGTMDITAGSDLISRSGLIGRYSGSTGEVTVDGIGSKWTIGPHSYLGGLSVGAAGSGTMNITNGGAVSIHYGIIGNQSGSTGTVTVSGSGSTWSGNTLYVGGAGSSRHGSGMMNITDGGLVSVLGLTIDGNGEDNSFINMATGGMLTLPSTSFGGEVSLANFLNYINGTDAIRYWDDSISGWADITGATYGVDYTLTTQAIDDLLSYTTLTVTTVPEPATICLLSLGSLLLRKRKS